MKQIMKVNVYVLLIINVTKYVVMTYVEKMVINVTNFMVMKINIFVVNQIIFVKKIVLCKTVKSNANQNQVMQKKNIIAKKIMNVNKYVVQKVVMNNVYKAQKIKIIYINVRITNVLNNVYIVIKSVCFQIIFIKIISNKTIKKK